jgi:lysophospholipase L1-like esterase
MSARFEADILAHQPHWLLLSAGVVEVRRTYQPERAQDRVSLDEYAENLSMMIAKAVNSNMHVILLEPTPHFRSVTDGPPGVTLAEVNALTRKYATAMREIAHSMGIGFVPLFDTFLDIEHRLAGETSLYADEVHLSPRGDLLYAQLVYPYLDLQPLI